MARLKNYRGSVELMSGLRSINDRGFPLIQANDVQVDEDGTRLDEVLERGGVSSWNDLEDRPFYDETYTGTMTFQYNGDPTGKITIDLGDKGTWVKISDWTTEPNELIGAIGTFGEETITITEEMITDMRGQGAPIVIIAERLAIIYSPFSVEGVVVSESGTYISDTITEASITFTGTATRVKKLDPKYLPSGYGGSGGKI